MSNKEQELLKRIQELESERDELSAEVDELKDTLRDSIESIESVGEDLLCLQDELTDVSKDLGGIDIESGEDSDNSAEIKIVVGSARHLSAKSSEVNHSASILLAITLDAAAKIDEVPNLKMWVDGYSSKTLKRSEVMLKSIKAFMPTHWPEIVRGVLLGGNVYSDDWRLAKHYLIGEIGKKENRNNINDDLMDKIVVELFLAEKKACGSSIALLSAFKVLPRVSDDLIALAVSGLDEKAMPVEPKYYASICSDFLKLEKGNKLEDGHIHPIVSTIERFPWEDFKENPLVEKMKASWLEYLKNESPHQVALLEQKWLKNSHIESGAARKATKAL